MLTAPPQAWFASPAFLLSTSHAIAIPRLVHSSIKHPVPMFTPMAPYVVLHAGWIYVLALKELESHTNAGPSPNSELTIGIMRDADTCMRLLRAAGSTGWKHLMQVFSVLREIAEGSEPTEESRRLLQFGRDEVETEE